MLSQLLTAIEVDRILRYRPGKAERLAKRGKLPHVCLPDGEIRFRETDILELINVPERTLSTEKWGS